MQNFRMSPQTIRCKGNNSNYAMEKPDTTLTTSDLAENYITDKEQMDVTDPATCFSEKDTHGKLYYSLERITRIQLRGSSRKTQVDERSIMQLACIFFKCQR